jgi:PIN domain nuclease of toxin-antitoxin system
LPGAWKAALRDPANDVYLSVVSVWEASIKYHIGKFPMPEPPEQFFPNKRVEHQIRSLPLQEADVAHLGALPPIHRDPFDRILICQALQNGLTLVTVDTDIRSYQVRCLPL